MISGTDSDRGGDVADRVEAPVRWRDARVRADDRAASPRAARAAQRRSARRDRVAGQGFELVERAAGAARGRGPRPSAPRRRRQPPAARAPDWSCRPRRRWNACRAAGRSALARDQSSRSPESVIACVSATHSSRPMPRGTTAIAKAAIWPFAPRAVHQAAHEGLDLGCIELLRAALAPDDFPGKHRSGACTPAEVRVPRIATGPFFRLGRRLSPRSGPMDV